MWDGRFVSATQVRCSAVAECRGISVQRTHNMGMTRFLSALCGFRPKHALLLLLVPSTGWNRLHRSICMDCKHCIWSSDSSGTLIQSSQVPKATLNLLHSCRLRQRTPRFSTCDHPVGWPNCFCLYSILDRGNVFATVGRHSEASESGRCRLGAVSRYKRVDTNTYKWQGSTNEEWLALVIDRTSEHP